MHGVWVARGLRIALAAEKDLQAVLNEDGYVERYTGVSSTNASQDHEQAKEALEATDETRYLLKAVTVGNQFPVWIRDDCTVLSFDTGNEIGAYSHVVINRDGTEMAVYYDGSR